MKAAFRWLSYLVLVMLCGRLVAQSVEDRILVLEQEMQEVGVVNPQGTYGAGFTTARTEGYNGWYLMVEPLYWHAKVGATEYAYTDKDVSLIAINVLRSPIKGQVKDQEFSWEWGVRVGLGTYFSHDKWDINLNYTWYEADESNSVSKTKPSAVLPLRLAESIPFQQAKSSYDLNYNNVNLEIGREYFMSSKVSLRSEIGVKSTWLDEKQHVQYSYPVTPNALRITGDVKLKDKSLMWGIGPRMGVTVNGYLGDGFSLYGRLTGAFLYTYSRTSYLMQADTNITSANLVHLRSSAHHFVPAAQMMLGLTWGASLNEKRQHVTLGAGYEVEYFWRANQTLMADNAFFSPFLNASRRLSLERAAEDVMFYGLTLKARLDF